MTKIKNITLSLVMCGLMVIPIWGNEKSLEDIKLYPSGEVVYVQGIFTNNMVVEVLNKSCYNDITIRKRRKFHVLSVHHVQHPGIQIRQAAGFCHSPAGGCHRIPGHRLWSLRQVESFGCLRTFRHHRAPAHYCEPAAMCTAARKSTAAMAWIWPAGALPL